MLLKKVIILIGIIVLFTNCKSTEVDTNTPNCIEHKIEQIVNNAVTNPPTQIWKWEVDNLTYYYVTSDCCDHYNYLLNNDCEIVCAPDGGITGNGDGNCPDFTSEIIKTLIFENKRN